MIEALERPHGQSELPHHFEAARRTEVSRIVRLEVTETELPSRICRASERS